MKEVRLNTEFSRPNPRQVIDLHGGDANVARPGRGATIRSKLWQAVGGHPSRLSSATSAGAAMRGTPQNERPVRGDNRTGQSLWALGVDGRSRLI